MRKSTGHILFFHDHEYFEVAGRVVRSKLENETFDPDGYRHGALPTAYESRGYVIREFQRLIDEFPLELADAVHPDDYGVIKPPSRELIFVLRFLKGAFGITCDIHEGYVKTHWREESLIDVAMDALGGEGIKEPLKTFALYYRIEIPMDKIPEIAMRLEENSHLMV